MGLDLPDLRQAGTTLSTSEYKYKAIKIAPRPTARHTQSGRPIKNRKPPRKYSKAQLDRILASANQVGTPSTGPQLLAVLERGRAGKTRGVLEAVRSLSLKSPGDASLMEDTDQFFGYCDAAAHTVSVFLVTPVGIRAWDGDAVMSDKIENAMRIDEQGKVSYSAGEYLEWSKNVRSASLAWSTRMPLEEVLQAARLSLGDLPSDAMGAIELKQSPVEIFPASKILEIVDTQPKDIVFLRLNFGDIALLWEPPVEGHDSVKGETAVIFRKITASKAENVLRSTATEKVRALAHVAVMNVLQTQGN